VLIVRDFGNTAYIEA